MPPTALARHCAPSVSPSAAARPIPLMVTLGRIVAARRNRGTGFAPLLNRCAEDCTTASDTQPAVSAKDSTAKLGLIIDAGSWALRGSVQPIADLPHDASPIRRLQRRRASDYEPP